VATRLGNITLIKELAQRGADPALTGSNGLNALQMALERALYDKKCALTRIAAIYPLLLPDSLAIQAEGRLIKLDKRLMGLFVLNLIFAMFYRHLGTAASRSDAFTAKDIAEQIQHLPEAILTTRRKRQTYISGILSSNEINRDFKYNRKLFLRIRRGHYVINPRLKIRLKDDWMAIHELLDLDDLDTPYRANARHEISA